MSLDARREATKLNRDLRPLGTPERAAGSKRYLKSDLAFVGVTMPDLRRVTKAFLKSNPDITRDELVDLVQTLWKDEVFELRMVAVVLLESRVDLLAATDAELIEGLLRDSKTWAFVDPLAINVMGPLYRAHPDLSRVLDRWAGDGDFWIRRSALLALLKLVKSGNDFDRFGRYADAMLDEKEFFIRKAIGWVLRELSKKDPETVRKWVEPRLERMSGVTRREATKYLDGA